MPPLPAYLGKVNVECVVKNVQSFTMYSPVWPQLLSENWKVVIGKNCSIKSIDPFPRIGSSMGSFAMVPDNNAVDGQAHMHTQAWY